MALTPKVTAEKPAAEGADPVINKETGAGEPGDQSAAIAAANKERDDALAKIEELNTQVSELSNGNDEALTKLREDHETALNDLTEKHRGELVSKNDEITQLKADLATAKAAAKSDAPAKPAKGKMLKVISNTGYNYRIDDDVQVTPDKAVPAERREGNVLDGHMKAGLIIEYEA